MFVVYSPIYLLRNDTGRRFRLESEAIHYVLRLRRAGHHAWYEAVS